ATDPYIIPGTGRTMGLGLLPRRQRPLAMRLAVVTMAACILAIGLFATVPLGGGGPETTGASPFQALAGAVVWHAPAAYQLYVVRAGDTIDSVAQHFGVQIGGIYELNNMLSGQDLQLGVAYKIPTDPNFGMYYRPPSYVVAGGGYGTTTYTDSPWTSLA